MKLKIVLEKGQDGYVVAHVPALKGCRSQGKTKTEALKNIKEAIMLYLTPDPQEIRPAPNHQVLELAV
jgi:predicted RNase H-like HicB family nuclease